MYTYMMRQTRLISNMRTGTTLAVECMQTISGTTDVTIRNSADLGASFGKPIYEQLKFDGLYFLTSFSFRDPQITSPPEYCKGRLNSKVTF